MPDLAGYYSHQLCFRRFTVACTQLSTHILGKEHIRQMSRPPFEPKSVRSDSDDFGIGPEWVPVLECVAPYPLDIVSLSFFCFL